MLTPLMVSPNQIRSHTINGMGTLSWRTARLVAVPYPTCLVILGLCSIRLAEKRIKIKCPVISACFEGGGTNVLDLNIIKLLIARCAIG